MDGNDDDGHKIGRFKAGVLVRYEVVSSGYEFLGGERGGGGACVVGGVK